MFYYTGDYDKGTLMKEINDYFIQYPKCTVLLYLRALIYFELAKEQEKTTHRKEKTYNELISKYENDINEASKIETNDTSCLIKDGITRENITKLFFMIVPEMDYYQPKPLVNYSSFQSGFKLFYIIFKCIKLFIAKLKKKKLKTFYLRKIKLTKLRDSSPDSFYINDNKMTSNSNSRNDPSSKSPLQSSDRKVSDKQNKELNIQCELIQLKKAYDNNIKQIYSSVFFASMNLCDNFRNYDLEVDIFSNYFIRNKYYAPFNLSSNILSLQERNDDPLNKFNNEDSITFSNQLDENRLGNKTNDLMHCFGNSIYNYNTQDNPFSELSVSLIKAKPNQESDFNVTNELKFFDTKESPMNNNNNNTIFTNNTNTIHEAIPVLFNNKQKDLAKPINSIKKHFKMDLKQDQLLKGNEMKENKGKVDVEVEEAKNSLSKYINKINQNIHKKDLQILNSKEIFKKRRISPDMIGKNTKLKLVFGKNKRIKNRQSNNSNRLEGIDSKSNCNSGKNNITNEY